jgi:CRP-like cAMP-binding protein
MSESGDAIGESPKQPGFAWQQSLAALPLATFEADETVVTQGRKSGRLYILKGGAVSIVKNGIVIATVTEPGAVFGELSALLDEPHTAHVRTIKPSIFHVADANMLAQEPAALLYVATLLARRLDLTTRSLVEIKGELATGASSSLIRSMLSKIEGLISFVGADYMNTGATHSLR